MNPSSYSDSSHLTIIGGGITGLVSAYLAAKSGKKVTLIEANDDIGGLLRTFSIGGNQLEHYYHHFFNHDAEINWLINELELDNSLMFRPTSMGIYQNGKIYDFNSPIDLLKFHPIGLPAKVMFGLSGMFMGKVADWRKYEHISAKSWLKKWAGKGATDSIWGPMLDIKFGPFAEDIPLSWMIGRMRQRLGSRNNVGREELGYLNGSLNILLQALKDKLNQLGVSIKVSSPIVSVDIQADEIKAVHTKSERIEGGPFLFTIPTNYLSAILQGADDELAKQLGAIDYFGAVCTILEMDRPLSNTYWLNVAEQGFPFGGVIEHTNFIDSSHYQNKHIAYLSRYFDRNDPLAHMPEEEISDMMIKPLSRIYPAFREQHIHKIHVFRTMTAAQVCHLKFSEKVPSCKTKVKGLFLANMAHIYPDERSVNNSVRIAAEALKVIYSTSYAENVPFGISLSGKIGF